MNTRHPSAHAPAPVHPHPHHDKAAAEASVAEESLSAHVTRAFHAKLRAAIAAILDPCIGLLKRLRGSAETEEAEDDENKHEPRQALPHGRHDTADEAGAEAETEAPVRKRRLLPLLVNLGVLLLGGMAGGALAYNLLGSLLERRTVENARLQETIGKQTKSIAANQKKLEEAQANLSDVQKKLETSSITAIEKKLEAESAKRIEAEAKLETYRAEYAKNAAGKQKSLDEATRVLGTIIAAERGAKAEAPGNRPGAKSAKTSKAGNCTLQTNNMAALKDCIADFNR